MIYFSQLPREWSCDQLEEENKAEKFDDAFPTHPLSRLRTYMKDIEKTFSYDALLENEPKFEYGIMR